MQISLLKFSDADIKAFLSAHSGAIEVIKWLAFVLMIGDHVGAYVFKDVAVLRDFGRLVLPLFAIAMLLGFMLSVNPVQSMRLAAGRMILVGIVATPAFTLLSGKYFPLNIMFSLAVALLVLSYYLQERYGYAMLFAMLSLFADYYFLPILLVMSVWLLLTRRTFMELGLVLCSLASLWFSNLNFYAFFVIPLVLLIFLLNARLPRIKYIFYWLYPAHLLLILSLSKHWV